MRAATVDGILNLPFSNRTSEDQLKIVAEGKPRPFLNMAGPAAVAKDDDEADSAEPPSYQFDSSMYDEVHWLTGCEIRQAFFCWPCLLFLPAKGLWNTTGISDLAAFLEGKYKHEVTFEHTLATLKLRDMAEKKPKASLVDVGVHNEIVKRNRAILKRMIDVVCNLLTKEQPSFKRINGCELDPENCVKTLKFLRSYDVLNYSYIEDAVDLLHITPNIVNDLVNAIAKVMKMAIRKEIQQSTYVSIILSSHSKTGEKWQISTVLRYLKAGKVCERFVEFYNMGEHKSMSAIYAHISRVLTEFAFSERFLSYSLDGGILQTSDLVELTLMMKNLHPFAFFVPWHGHGVHHVLQQSLSNMEECGTFFKTMDEMENFFCKKTKRFKALEDFMAKNAPSMPNVKKFFFPSRFIQVVHSHREYFVQFFDSILKSSAIWEPDDVTKALGFREALEDFQSVFLLQTFAKLLKLTSTLGNVLKGPFPEKVFTTRQETVHTINSLMAERFKRAFGDLWNKIHMNKSLEVAAKTMKLDLDDPQAVKYSELYQSIINRAIQEVDVRFNQLDRLSFCQLLICNKAGQWVFSYDMLEALISAHGAYFDQEQVNHELIVLRSNGRMFDNKTTENVLDVLTQSKLKGVFKYVYKLCELILTLPIRSPTEEVSMAKFKQIRDWSYTTRTTGLHSGDISIPCVEMEFLQELKKSSSFHDEITVTFQELNKTFELLQR